MGVNREKFGFKFDSYLSFLVIKQNLNLNYSKVYI